MLIEFIIIFQIALLLLLMKSYKERDEIIWALTIILAGILIFTSNNIQFHSFINNEVGQFVMISYDSVELRAINIGIFLISVIFLFIDLITNYWSIVVGKIRKLKKDD